MNDHLPDIHNAIDDYFSDMDERPSLQYEVLAQTREKIEVKKKRSVGMAGSLQAHRVLSRLQSHFSRMAHLLQDRRRHYGRKRCLFPFQ